MKTKTCNITLFSALVACFSGMSDAAFADSRGVKAYADAYNQVNIIREQQAYLDAQAAAAVQPASATVDLPVAVEDEKLARAITENKSDTKISDLERCSMIYPNGVFKWGIPQSGIRKNQKPQCIAVVNLVDAETKSILATTTVAAGDAMRCNIDMFPEEGYEVALSNVELPADEPPTMKDAEKALNKEQKHNAGIKIAAAALIGGLAGNMLGPKKKDDDKLLGTGKMQLLTTAAGAAGAAGLMAASSYSGKVAGDTIKSTAASATAGMLAGNMAAGLMSSESVLGTTKCTVKVGDKSEEMDCVPGRAYKATDTETVYMTKGGTTVYTCNKNNDQFSCTSYDFIDLTINGKSIEKITDWDSIDGAICKETDGGSTYSASTCTEENVEKLFKGQGKKYSEDWAAYAVFKKDLPTKPLGYKVGDFDKLKKNPGVIYYERKSDNTVGNKLNQSVSFEPAARNAQDGSIIDLNNEARAKATMLGTAAGGALGGFSGYQGAQAEIVDRWTTAMREYDEYLLKFYCATGTRYLNKYNEYFEIADMSVVPETEQ